ncbi:GIY-YIG nuclease family protein [Pasteurellaceae bacterium USgator11]|nr:GIY-YIG nuclease family protein [Pasteurellaceae bacterium USgator41]TNG96484.1 GIY-YIG nuclease family protein [Pasteurellaceae bacterium UScroc12]TNH00434.1 GIY-YIG nuclease family protein [Pasteurellaceae bacterium UScroc31]TNH01735.1 GIY-YIG nuclease family protein [Pasteurellaceae bacterium USgator11]
MQLANPENNNLIELLQISETANKSFDHLIDCIADAVNKCSAIKISNTFNDNAIDILQVKKVLQVMILASGNDKRVINIAQTLLDNSDISPTEMKILNNGEVIKRKIYFVQRSDGSIKIGSSLDIQRRIKEISALVGEIKLLCVIDGTIQIEKYLHKKFINDHIHNEWFAQGEINNFIRDLSIK